MTIAFSICAISKPRRSAGWSKWALRILVGIAISFITMVVFYAGLLASVLYSLRVIEF